MSDQKDYNLWSSSYLLLNAIFASSFMLLSSLIFVSYYLLNDKFILYINGIFFYMFLSGVIIGVIFLVRNKIIISLYNNNRKLTYSISHNKNYFTTTELILLALFFIANNISFLEFYSIMIFAFAIFIMIFTTFFDGSLNGEGQINFEYESLKDKNINAIEKQKWINKIVSRVINLLRIHYISVNPNELLYSINVIECEADKEKLVEQTKNFVLGKITSNQIIQNIKEICPENKVQPYYRVNIKGETYNIIKNNIRYILSFIILLIIIIKYPELIRDYLPKL